MPRFEVKTGNIEVRVRKDGYGDFEVVTGFAITQDYDSRVLADDGVTESIECIDDASYIIGFYNESYYSNLDVSLDFLTEGDTYYLEMYYNDKLWYRDKIYATTQTDFKVKHKQSLNNYDQYNELDDNTYIIRN